MLSPWQPGNEADFPTTGGELANLRLVAPAVHPRLPVVKVVGPRPIRKFQRGNDTPGAAAPRGQDPFQGSHGAGGVNVHVSDEPITATQIFHANVPSPLLPVGESRVGNHSRVDGGGVDANHIEISRQEPLAGSSRSCSQFTGLLIPFQRQFKPVDRFIEFQPCP